MPASASMLFEPTQLELMTSAVREPVVVGTPEMKAERYGL